ncbi:MAG: transglycosylase domain-containing protein [Peptostreptococcaceae bacterium]
MSNGNNEDQNKIRRKKVSSSNKTTKPNESSTKNTNSRTQSRKKGKKDKFRFFKLAGIFILAILVVGSALGTGLVFSSLKDVQPVTKALLDEKTYEPSKLYYSTGDFMANASSEIKKEAVPLEDMNDTVKEAIVAIEDQRFYEHNGVDIKGLARSFVKTLLGDKQGGSTLPMQVSKMLLTNSEQTLPRKVKDIYYAYEMSKNLSKEEILEVYLNNMPVGRGLNGVQVGAQGYFSKDAKDLELHESALLAGSTKHPSKYSAYIPAKLDGSETKEELEYTLLIHTNTDSWDNPTEIEKNMIPKLQSWGLIDSETAGLLADETLIVRKAVNNPDAKARQELVLAKMLELEYITQEEHDKAVAAKIEIKLPKKKETVVSSVQDLIESDVIDALMEQGHTEDEADNLFRNGGLKIKTTIDPNMQDILEEEYDNDLNFPGRRLGPNGIPQPQSASVILDHKTGQIKALVGGRHVKTRKGLNRAIKPQQPGSTIKPLSVYTPAIDLKITQSESLSDKRGGYKFRENNSWNPATTTPARENMSLRKALAWSSNTIAVKTAEMLGDTYEESVDVMLDYLNNFGITSIKNSKTGDINEGDRRFPSLTLGGMTYGVSPLEMASAYATLANGGVYIEPTIFTTIETSDNQLLVKSTPMENRVVSPEVAFVVTDMLESVVKEGTGTAASLGGRFDVAGKTGTTNSKLEAWFVGYTPYYVMSTYIADDAGVKDPNTGELMKRRGVAGSSSSAARLWSKIMRRVHENLTEAHFKAPEGVYFTKINLVDGGKSPSGVSAAFINGTAPKRVSSYQPPPPPPKEEEPQEPEEPEEPEEETDNSGDVADPPTDDNNKPDTDDGSKPVEPENPDTGDENAKPDVEVDTNKPVKPEKPVKPDTENVKPEKPEKPDTQVNNEQNIEN